MVILLLYVGLIFLIGIQKLDSEMNVGEGQTNYFSPTITINIDFLYAAFRDHCKPFLRPTINKGGAQEKYEWLNRKITLQYECYKQPREIPNSIPSRLCRLQLVPSLSKMRETLLGWAMLKSASIFLFE